MNVLDFFAENRKGALDGSRIMMRYYSATMAIKGENPAEPEMITKFFRTLEDLVKVVEEVMTRNENTIITSTAHLVSPEQYKKFWTSLNDGTSN